MRAHDVRWAGDRCLILDFDTLDAAMSARTTLDTAAVDGQIDLIAGAQTLLVRLRSHWHAARALPLLRAAEFPITAAPTAAEHLIDVIYDGEDLDAVSSALNMSAEALVNWHTNQSWLAAFSGIAGFVYCVTEGEPLSVTRRPTPRSSVPGGSVILAAGFSGIYPRTGPSGWQIVGRTETPVWVPDRERPALISPRDRVRYRPTIQKSVSSNPTPATSHVSYQPCTEQTHCDPPEQAALEVLKPGMTSLIEDRGRQGFSADGLGISGVADRLAGFSGNDLVGNSSDAAVIESLLGQLHVRALRTVVVAVTGAQVEITIESDAAVRRAEPMNTPFVLLHGERLSLGTPESGARTFLAARGGILAGKMLGSASTDTHAGIGPPPIATGDVLRIGQPANAVASPGGLAESRVNEIDVVELRCIFGPRHDWFSLAERQRLTQQTWEVSTDSDRIGLQLFPQSGERPLTRESSDELLSEGLALGSIQIPPSGNPVLLLNDQAITGGYPIIAVVIEPDLIKAGQLVPGDSIKFQPVDPSSAGYMTANGGGPL